MESTTDGNSSFESELSSNPAQISDEMTTIRVRFRPKVPPTEYQRFIYKCHDCMLGFKRRGMLVNHMAKVHPGVRIDSVHELCLPILKTERCYYCLYCDKVYKSSTKRKAHILKYHPGQALPHSTRGQNDYENAQVPNASFSHSIGSITTRAHQCSWCYKQYASRNRLLQHQRHAHNSDVQNIYNDNTNEYFRDQNFEQNHFQSYEMPNRMVDHNGFAMNHNGFNHPEPENKLLRLSSAALEASIRDDLSFLDANDDLSGKMANSSVGGTMNNSSTLPKVDVNFKVGDEFVDASTHPHCELNPLPQLFEGIDCMSLRSGHFNSANEHNSSGDSIGKVVFPN